MITKLKNFKLNDIKYKELNLDYPLLRVLPMDVYTSNPFEVVWGFEGQWLYI